MGHREELLAAARRLIEERGYARITARDLVAASDTNLASIGYHFGSKEALLNAALEASLDDWADQIADLAMSDAHATPMQRAAATWVASLASAPARAPLVQSYIEALAQAMRVPEVRDQLAAHYARARTRVAALVSLAVGDGVEPDDPRCVGAAALVIAACDGLAMQWMLDSEAMPGPDVLAESLAMVLDASVAAITTG